MVQVSIGFQASPPLGVRVEQSDLDSLLGAVGGTGWHDLRTSDGAVKLNLEHVPGSGRRTRSAGSASAARNR
jgi:hypothetical protein